MLILSGEMVIVCSMTREFAFSGGSGVEILLVYRRFLLPMQALAQS